MDDETWADMERVAAPRAPAPAGLSLWLSPKGRIPRSTYWLKIALPLWGLQILGSIVDAVTGHLDPSGLGPVSAVVTLLLVWPGIAAAVKRLHDLGYSGWIIPGIYGSALVAGIATAIAIPAGAPVVVALPLLGFIVAVFWISIKMMFFRGTVGPNAYGPDPLARV